MADLTPKLKFILGPKQQEYCVGSLHMNSWILSQPGLQAATDIEILCFRLTVQGKTLVARVGACRPFPVLAFSSDQVSILGWDAVQHLQHCGAYSIVI